MNRIELENPPKNTLSLSLKNLLNKVHISPPFMAFEKEGEKRLCKGIPSMMQEILRFRENQIREKMLQEFLNITKEKNNPSPPDPPPPSSSLLPRSPNTYAEWNDFLGLPKCPTATPGHAIFVLTPQYHADAVKEQDKPVYQDDGCVRIKKVEGKKKGEEPLEKCP